MNSFQFILTVGLVEGYYGVPRAGKTFIATGRVLEELERGKKDVYTNYPVRHPKTGKWSKKWSRDGIYKVHNNALIVIDEAYRDYDYRNTSGGQQFTEDEDLYFGTSGQNNIDIIWIAHSPVRVDPKIRDRTEIYHYITKQTLPVISFLTKWFFDREIILWFNDRAYLSESDAKAKGNEPYADAMRFFSRKTAKAYDTRQFMCKLPNEPMPTWGEILGQPDTPRQTLQNAIRAIFTPSGYLGIKTKKTLNRLTSPLYSAFEIIIRFWPW